MALIFVGLALDVATFKWRALTSLMLYHDLVINTVVWMVPNPVNNHTDENIFILFSLVFVCYYTDSRAQILAICAMFLFASSFLQVQLDEEP